MDEQRAREILGRAVTDEGFLWCGNPVIDWDTVERCAMLDGDFTIDQLEAIAWWMRNKGDM